MGTDGKVAVDVDKFKLQSQNISTYEKENSLPALLVYLFINLLAIGDMTIGSGESQMIICLF